jgi:EAL domain-containing protein (putative c-di-GMP-specific phosphodiesterase class I)
LGAKVWLDDFETGYASLIYLRRFGFDNLKIDRQFINDIEGDDDAKTLVESIVWMSQALGLKVTAEGVENDDKHAFLKSARCDRLQGFHFSEPLRQNEMAGLFPGMKSAA